MVYGGTFTFAPTNSIVQDVLFDKASISNWNGYTGGYNAYVANLTRLQPTNATDLVLSASPSYQVCPLGNYYQLTNSVLIDADTSTTADQVGYFHYATTTNLVNGLEVKETTTHVDVTLHYVAVDSNGNPIDTNGDGFPDYLQDANGNGVVDSGETDWQNAGDLGLKVWITEPKRNANLP